jgi:hypothetical protein
MRRPWDLETYVLAARAAQAGLDPSSPASLEVIAGRAVGMQFLYPSVTLPLFFPLAQLPIPAATVVWLAVKLVALLVLFQIWRGLLPKVPLVILAPAAGLAFNASIVWDLRAGNVTAVQDLLIWLGLAAYVRGQRAIGAGGIVASALFKIVPATFLCLTVLPTRWRPAWGLLLVSAVCLLLLIYGLPAIGLGWAPPVTPGLAFAGPWGASNPSALGLANSFSLRSTGLELPQTNNVLLWLTYAGILGLVSLFPLRRAWAARDAALWVFTLTPLFVLFQPRPMALDTFSQSPPLWRWHARSEVPEGSGWSDLRWSHRRY